ncbi:hypothetical protein SAMN05443582_101461 [Phyllobacterium sp. OV277]|nr:hypothetical protein SAMN05443582_101461 [Phyllobacterium sp. OV277]
MPLMGSYILEPLGLALHPTPSLMVSLSNHEPRTTHQPSTFTSLKSSPPHYSAWIAIKALKPVFAFSFASAIGARTLNENRCWHSQTSKKEADYSWQRSKLQTRLSSLTATR